MSKIRPSKKHILLIGISLQVLVGCVSNPSKYIRNLPDDADTDKVDIQQALSERGLYLHENGNVKIKNKSSCNAPIIESHRGHYSQPENSEVATKDALIAGYGGVELDAMQLKDGTWVLHHDYVTGRVVSTSKKISVKLMSRRQWRRFELIDRKGKSTSEDAAFLKDAISSYKEYGSNTQYLNIEIKGNPSCRDLRKLDNKIKKELKSSQYGYSAMDIKALECIRGTNSDIYLGVVQFPHLTSIKKTKKQHQSKNQHLKNAVYSRLLKYNQTSKNKYTRNWSTRSGLRHITEKLGENSGLHLDIRTLTYNSKILARAKKAGLKTLSTYSINGSKYHLKQLVKLKKKHIVPDTIITDEDPIKVCQIYSPKLFKRTNHSSLKLKDPIANSIVRLPGNADFHQLKRQLSLSKKSQYLDMFGLINELHIAGVTTLQKLICHSCEDNIPRSYNTRAKKRKKYQPITIEIK